MQLPKYGPAWAGALMGTSIASTLSGLHGFRLCQIAFALCAAVLLAVFTVGARHEPPRHQNMAAWGMYTMGLLSCGSAWTALTGNDGFQLASWWIGAPLSALVCLWQLWAFWKRPSLYRKPAFPWGLALVTPMVAATSGGQLSDEHGALYHYVGVVCFWLTLTTAIPLFAYCFWSFMRHRYHPSGAAAGTAWIPLGVVGQSTAASTVLFDAHLYGIVMFVIGVPCSLFAVYCFYQAVVAISPYGPGWWGATFPVGTLCLGAWYQGWSQLSFALLILLLVHWSICAVRFWAWQLQRL
ncbi:Tellurite resistance protein TehA [Corynebacterium coyleae]|uniref:Tellurite resistance protein TehA n=1 Tax=Corynebacterium coyleae TaxID=53374 RepID=A0ABX8KXH1_9CORY|nr:hypothetical protein [Corynebacterium coyleae]QXB18519.1 hypothetical protein I6L55_11885 [Corynebacterium coyleae]WJY80026.1 C4-dicarboxylate transporter/malic acid transport protein [Corynebacterium coyleae]SEC02892.1 Tellurite resistance protein TehA [Corynebacterium coyleae]